LGVDILEKYCESCVKGMSKKFLTREDTELSQRASTQALSMFRQSMMDDMNNLWQTVIMRHASSTSTARDIVSSTPFASPNPFHPLKLLFRFYLLNLI